MSFENSPNIIRNLIIKTKIHFEFVNSELNLFTKQQYSTTVFKCIVLQIIVLSFHWTWHKNGTKNGVKILPVTAFTQFNLPSQWSQELWLNSKHDAP